MFIYYAGESSVTLTVTKGRIDGLSIAIGETHEEPQLVAAPRAAAQEPVRTDTLPTEEEMTVGQRFLLPVGRLANHTGDSVAQQVPGRPIVAISMAGIRARSGPAKERLGELLRRGPVLLEITECGRADSVRYVAARLSVDGEDLAAMMAQEGWAIVVKAVPSIRDWRPRPTRVRTGVACGA